MVDLRCPECLTWMQGCFSKDDMKELDRLQTAGREEIPPTLRFYTWTPAEARAALEDGAGNVTLRGRVTLTGKDD